MAETEDKLRRKIARLKDRIAWLAAMVEVLHRKWGVSLHQASRLANLLVANAEKAGLDAVPSSRGASDSVQDRLGDTKIVAGHGKSVI